MQRRGDLSPDSDPDALAYSLLAAPLLMLAESNVASGRPTGG
jgi:hypothetical protein